MTDVLLRHFDDGGDINFVNGEPILSEGLETAAYLSMFGGNERDSGIDGDDPFEWWGNKIERLPERRYRSQAQNLLASLPLIPINLRRIEDAALADLAWFVETKLATFLQVIASIPAVNTVQITVDLVIADEEFQFVFTKGPTATTAPGPVPPPPPPTGGAFVTVTGSGTLTGRGALTGTATAGATATGILTTT